MPFTEYQTRVSERQYDLYIGEIKLKDNLDLTSLFTVQTQQTTEENLQALEGVPPMAAGDSNTSELSGFVSVIGAADSHWNP